MLRVWTADLDQKANTNLKKKFTNMLQVFTSD